MRVLIAFDWFLKLVVEGQVRGLRDLGHDVLLLCRDHAYEFGGDAAERSSVLDGLRRDGVAVVELAGRRYGPETAPDVIRARRAVRRWRPDIVGAHENNDPRLLAICLGTPIVYTIHDPVPHPGADESLAERGTDWLWRRIAKQLVVQGDALADALPAVDRRKGAAVIPHGVEVAATTASVPADPVILLFGRLEPYKGVRVLMDAMSHVWAEEPRARVVVAGRGPAANEVRRDDRVTLLDRYIAESEVPALLHSASVTVLPYLEASQSGVGLLSISSGVPVVVTRTGALPDLAVDQAYVAPPGDPAALARCVLHALRASADERDRILAFAHARFNWPVVAQQYARLFKTVLH